MASRGVAILPEGMSQEQFDWLNRWCENPENDIIRTHGTESNVKEIYDACNELAKDPGNFILNQFSEFGNHLGPLLRSPVGRSARVRNRPAPASGRDLRLAAFMSATGSAGTIAAGDRLKDEYGAQIVAVEALECPTMLENGYGEHNIQGIGDKHIPLIHNVMNTDVVCAISDVATDELDVLFNTDEGRHYLSQSKGLGDELVDQLPQFGFSSICNMLAAIKTASCSASAPTTPSSPWRPTAPPLPERAGQAAGISLPTASTATPMPPKRSVNTWPRVDRAHDRPDRSRPAARVPARLLHVGRAAGHPVRTVRTPRPELLASAAALRQCVE